MLRTMQMSPAPTRYRIVVKGTLSARFDGAFEGLEREQLAGQTALVGDFRDQAQLHGVLERMRDLGMELVSVNAVP